MENTACSFSSFSVAGQPLPKHLITDQGERAMRLRQSTPFAGVLSARERERVYAAFRP
jgi:hypothetical protein